jgi:hypothetical protein
MSKLTKEKFLQKIVEIADSRWTPQDTTEYRGFDSCFVDLWDANNKAGLALVNYCRSRLERK